MSEVTKPTGEELYAAYRRNLHKEHTPQGTIDELKTLVTSIRLYAIPELPANEIGQVPFFRVFFDTVVDQIEASIRRQETDCETTKANESYIAAIPALCRGEVVPCALHASQPIAELRSSLSAAETRVKELESELAEARRVMEPFNEVAKEIEPDDTIVDDSVTVRSAVQHSRHAEIHARIAVGDFRRLAAFLTRGK